MVDEHAMLRAAALVQEMRMTVSTAESDQARFGQWMRDYAGELRELRARFDALVPKTADETCAEERFAAEERARQERNNEYFEKAFG